MKQKIIPTKPTVFIASSGKAKDIAEAIKLNFDHEADVDIWTENVFKLNENTLEVLLNRSSYYDFFIAVFAADDKAVVKGKSTKVTRGNVIFEFGLFLGRIGINRSFLVLEDGVDMISDFAGITTTTFTRRDNLVAALGASCIRIREGMSIATKLMSYSMLPSTALAVGYYHNFLEEILNALNSQKSIEVVLERDKLGKAIKTIDYEIKAPYPTIEIRVPRKLSSLKKDILTSETRAYQQIVINASSRPYAFYILGEFSPDKPIQLIDIPTTLYASYLTINTLFKSSFLATENNLEKLVDKEIRNFEQTLSKLIPDNIEKKFYRFKVY